MPVPIPRSQSTCTTSLLLELTSSGLISLYVDHIHLPATFLLTPMWKNTPGMVSTTANSWSVDMTHASFLGVTAHWMEVMNWQWKLQSEVFGFHGVSGEHSGENLGWYFMGVCERVRVMNAKQSKVIQLDYIYLIVFWLVIAPHSHTQQHIKQHSYVQDNWDPPFLTKTSPVDFKWKPTAIHHTSLSDPVGWCFIFMDAWLMSSTLQTLMWWVISLKSLPWKWLLPFGNMTHLLLITLCWEDHWMSLLWFRQLWLRYGFHFYVWWYPLAVPCHHTDSSLWSTYQGVQQVTDWVQNHRTPQDTSAQQHTMGYSIPHAWPVVQTSQGLFITFFYSFSLICLARLSTSLSPLLTISMAPSLWSTTMAVWPSTYHGPHLPLPKVIGIWSSKSTIYLLHSWLHQTSLPMQIHWTALFFSFLPLIKAMYSLW